MNLLRLAAPTFRSDREWTFDVPPTVLWDRVTSTQDYPGWWPWLERFRPESGFCAGARWHCTVSPPLPYVLRFTVHLDDVDAPNEVTARIDGDIRGDAVLTVEAAPGGSSARVRSSLAPANPLLRGVGTAMRPLVEWGHDWVLDTGRRQFVDRAFSEPVPDGD